MRNKLLTSFLLFIVINSSYAGSPCSDEFNFYSSVEKYIQSCQSIGVLPSYYGEPNNSGTPRTTAKVVECQSLLAQAHSSANNLILSQYSDEEIVAANSCITISEEKTARVIMYKSMFGLNKSFGMISPCEDNVPIYQPSGGIIRYSELIEAMYPHLCTI